MIVLERDNDRAGVEAKNLGEIGTVKPPQFAGGGGLLLEVGDHVSCPIDLVGRDEILAHLQDPLDQVVAALDRVEGAAVHSAELVYEEVGVGRLKQDVVLRGLDVELTGIEVLPGGQRLEDDIGEVDVLPEAGAGLVEVRAVYGHDALVEVGAAAVVPDIVVADHERGNPEDLGPGQLGFGHPHTGLGGRYNQRPSIAQPQCGREVDRQAEVGRFQRRLLELDGQRLGRLWHA